MTPDEYKRRFHVARKQEEESWAQFSTDLNTMFGYYMESRKVDTLDDLRQLIISDWLKHVMPDDVRAYVLPNETKEWLRPKEVAELAEKFEESTHGRNWKPQRAAERPQLGATSEGLRNLDCQGAFRVGYWGTLSISALDKRIEQWAPGTNWHPRVFVQGQRCCLGHARHLRRRGRAG
ncbi:hypothetical protein HPB47_016721, partial [Ixodes persulcatus]